MSESLRKAFFGDGSNGILETGLLKFLNNDGIPSLFIPDY